MKTYTIISASVWLSILSFVSSDYDAGTEIRRRVENLHKVCQKYRDPRRPEYNSLLTSYMDYKKLYRVIPSEEERQQGQKAFFICVPLKVATNSWRQLTVRMYNAMGEDVGFQEMKDRFGAIVGHEQTEYKKAARAIQVRHPLERFLSAYIFTFRDSTTHRDMSLRIRDFWLAQRADPLTPREDENATDASGHYSLTFRQFVNMVTKCPSELRECVVTVNDGLGHHWSPFWRWCNPCEAGIEPNYILDLAHMQEDKNYVMNALGFNASIAVDVKNPSKHGAASDPKVQKEYFGQLTKREIYDLYMKYKLDHELFGYSPDSFIDYGRGDLS